MARTPLICYDCGGWTDDYVLRIRQVSGGDGVVYEGDFQSRPVHVNRKECETMKQMTEIERRRARDPFYDVPAC